MKFKNIIVSGLLFLCAACGGGGGGGHDYSGIWNVQGYLTINNCGGNQQRSLNYNIRVDQSGKDIVIFDGQNTFVGSTDGIDEYIEDGFAAQHIHPSGLEDHIYVIDIKGNSGRFIEHFYVPERRIGSYTQFCEITYNGTATRISENKAEIEVQNKIDIVF